MAKRFHNNILLYCCFIFLLTQSCNLPVSSLNLKEGDLLFQNLNCGDLCNAIEAVTKGVNGKDFSHCGMVVLINDSLKVVEAIGEEVQVNTLKAFFARSGDTSVVKNITVGRVKKKYVPLIEVAKTIAIQKIGQPYDHEFILDNGSWYCSELLYDAFKSANGQEDFFELAPMTYKDPKNQNYFPAWEDYYKQLNKQIPEGELGLNPGSISRSDKIRIIEFDKF